MAVSVRHHEGMWRHRRQTSGIVREDVDAIGLMLMSMDGKLDEILDELREDNGREEEEEDD
jgi:hypothetical protein